MSMSFDCTCKKCGKEFGAWYIKPLCNDCMDVVKLKDLPPNKPVKITDGSGYKTAYLFAKDLSFVLPDYDTVTNDSSFKVVLWHDEIQAIQNHLGKKIIWEDEQ